MATTLALVLISAGDGGYFPDAWGWIGVTAAWSLALLALLESVAVLTWPERLYVGAIGTIALLTAASIGWSSAAPATGLEVQRVLILPVALLLMLLVLRQAGIRATLAGLFAGVALGCGIRAPGDLEKRTASG